MKLYVISQNTNNGYDTYDSAVVAAKTEARAVATHPQESEWDGKDGGYGSWCNKEDVTARLIGVAVDGMKAGVITTSFNAG